MALRRVRPLVSLTTMPQEIAARGLLVSKRMFAMHVPDFQAAVMEECAPRPGQRMSVTNLVAIGEQQ